MKKIIWMGVCVMALVSIAGCSDRPSSDVFKAAIGKQLSCPPADDCIITDYKITNEWTKMDSENELHHYYTYTATWKYDGKTGTKDNLNYPLDLVLRGSEWYVIQD